MNPLDQAAPPRLLWKDLTGDFLEMACFLKEEEKDFLLGELAPETFTSNCLEVHPSFSLNGIAVLVSEENALRECWVYFPKLRKIRKIRL